MWASSSSAPLSALPDRSSRRLKNAASSAPTSPHLPQTSAPSPQPQSPPAVVNPSQPKSIIDLLERAVDGPPSPESIRKALNQQLRLQLHQQTAAKLERQTSIVTTSSGSSSRSHGSADTKSSTKPANTNVINLGKDVASIWEQALVGLNTATDSPATLPTLSRKSSGRSTSSIMPPGRERADSVQFFGKTLFGRNKTKQKRESSDHSSTSSSIYSNDLPLELVPSNGPSSPPPSSSSNIIPSIFSRRKASRPDSVLDDSPEARRRLQISGPYDFKHVSHTPNERTNSMLPQSANSVTRSSRVPSSGSLQGGQAEATHFADFSDENLPLATEKAPVSPPPLRRLNRSISQDQLRMPPPLRPFRPSDDADMVTAPPVPPRSSSRMSAFPSFDSSSAAASDERPATSSGVPRDAPRLPATLEEGDEEAERSGDDDVLVMRRRVRGESQVVPAEYRYSRVLPSPTPDDLNWPLASPALNSSFEAPALAEVPEEEEEEPYPARSKSRASIMSNASLKGSQSVPMLRNLVTKEGSAPPAATTAQRPPSNASDRRFDIAAAQRALILALEKTGVELPTESWEDAIDYCYEHEVEADCEYAWERPSFDSSRDDQSLTPVENGAGSSRMSDASNSSPTMLNPNRSFDMPALSPASQVSTASNSMEAITPTILARPPSSHNFSLPRAGDAKKQPPQPLSLSHLHARSPSIASTFKESQGFTLSPSLLIPGSDYSRMMSDEPEWYPGQDEITCVPYEEPVLSMETSTLLIQPRISSSTVASTDSDRAGSDRHISTNSVSTDFTRLTLSSSSVDIQGLAAKGECPPLTGGAAALGTSPDPPVIPVIGLTRSRGQSEPLNSLRPSFEEMETNIFDEAFAVTNNLAYRRTKSSNSISSVAPGTQRNFSHIMPTSPIKTKDESAAAKPPTRHRPNLSVLSGTGAAAPKRRGRAMTTSLATPPIGSAYSLFPTVTRV